MYGYLRCPQCGEVWAERSRTRGVERLLKLFTRSRPYRCAACGWRGWCVDVVGGLLTRRRGQDTGARRRPV